MSKAVLISIRPEWVELIASGKKTIEVRKTAPKLEPPFRCYIYCTKGKDLWLAGVIGKREAAKLNGKVVGEFICDRMDYFGVPFPAYMNKMDPQMLHDSCLTYMDLHLYAGHRGLYAWHISDLKIYDKPKSVLTFLRPECERESPCTLCPYWTAKARNCMRNPFIQRAPQDWAYTLGPFGE